MADVYAARTGQKPDAVARWMDGETYMNGSVAVDRGFADSLLPADQLSEDPKAKADDQAANKLRAMELTLCASGLSRSQARARINEIKGTPGAAPEGTPGAASNDWTAEASKLLAALKSG
jgi:ATP-dependent Clp protease, protease subunit